MKILFATQTGNSEDVAERIGRKVKCRGVSVSISNISYYNICNLVNEQCILFVCSTTGQGDCPDDMQIFWKFLLRKSLPHNSLCSLTFGIIGLGDSSYDRYNVVAKRLSKRLLQLGAELLFPVVLCDDQHELGYDGALEPWLKDFFDINLHQIYPSAKAIIDDNYLLPPKYKVEFLAHKKNNLDNKMNGLKLPVSIETLDTAEVVENSRITAEDHFQDVRLIKFKIGKDVSYQPGDVVVLMPENEPQNIVDFENLFNFPLNDEFVLHPTDAGTNPVKGLPMPCTLRDCITSYWDIQGIPKRSFFDILWHFSKDETEKEKLQEFTTAEGQEELYSYCNRPRRNIIEVLQDFPHTTPYIPIDYLFDLLPRIRPRSFSIASSLKYHTEQLHILVAVVKYKTRLFKPREGLCSTWLSRLVIGSKIPFSIKHGTVALPLIDCPLVLIGPGTGCAPFRGFIEERFLNGFKDNHLFFGCRYKDKDFLCQEEWLWFVSQSFLNLHTAFSRDQEQKVYVQHKMLENSRVLWTLLDEHNAHIYIAGNSKNMPNDVKNTLLEILQKEGNLQESESQVYIQKLEKENRFTTETWS